MSIISRSTDKSINLPSNMPMPNCDATQLGMWQAAARGILAVQKCKSCEHHRYPPTQACRHCGSFDWEWEEISGKGTLISFSWLLDPARDNKPDWPSTWYNVAIVKLDHANIETAHMVTNIVNAWHPGDLSIGQRVQLHCVRLDDQIGLPCFELAGDIDHG